MIDLTLYAQRDTRWGSVMLGNNPPGTTDRAGHPYSIGYYGCLLCCMSMLANIPPDVMNEYRKSHGGFMPGSGLAANWDISDCSTFVRLGRVSNKWSGIDAPKREVDDLLKWLDHDPAIIEVDSSLVQSGQQQHFVVSPGLFGGSVAILDPWYGDRSFLLPRYGGTNAFAIYRFIEYTVSR